VAPVIGMPPSMIERLKLSGDRDPNKGLTMIGEQVVAHMLDIGMIVDLTHCTRTARKKVFEINDKRGAEKRPLVFTHVGVSGLSDHPMNPDETEINKIKECEGTIGIIFYNFYLMGKEEDDPFSPIVDFNPEPGINYIIETIDKIHTVTGTYDNISIGSDLDGFTDPPDDLYNLARFKFLKEKLIQKYGIVSAGKILGDNMLRVLKLGWGNNN
jgi:membrane dipeptidase